MSADFFDPERMFGIADGFDVVTGNPPYVQQEQIKELKPALKERSFALLAWLTFMFIFTNVALRRAKLEVC